MTVAQSDACNDLQTESTGDTKKEGNESIVEIAGKENKNIQVRHTSCKLGLYHILHPSFKLRNFVRQ